MQSAETFVRKPDGGFRFITAEQLFMAWWCYRVNQIRLFDLRIWFALHEIVSRRCQQNKKSTSNYEIDEVGDLIACTDLTAIRAGLRRLATCGLAVCTTRQIAFAKYASELNGYDAAEFTDTLHQIPNR